MKEEDKEYLVINNAVTDDEVIAAIMSIPTHFVLGDDVTTAPGTGGETFRVLSDGARGWPVSVVAFATGIAPGANTLTFANSATPLPVSLGGVSTVSVTGTVVASLTGSLPAGSSVIGSVNINSAIPAGTNGIGSVTVTGTSTVTLTGSLPAGANTIGTVNTIPVPQASGGYSKFKVVSANSTYTNNVKASAGTLYGWIFTNSSSSPAYVKMYDSAGTPTAGAGTVDFTFEVPANGGTNIQWGGAGIAYVNGIALTITGGVLENDTTALTASQITGVLLYK